MDYLKELSIALGGKIEPQENQHMNFKEKSFSRLSIKSYREFKIQIDEYGHLFLIQIKVLSDLTLSINNPNKLSSIDRLIKVKNSPYEFYIFKKSYKDFIKGHKYNPFLSRDFQKFWNSFSDEIGKLKLSEDETISIRENGLFFVLHNNRHIKPILDDTIVLINDNEAVFKRKRKKSISSKNIPDNLKSLLPLVKEWAISDDVEREQLIEKTSEKRKKKLISVVEPLMPEIDEFLDSFKKQPLNEEATLIGNLAELVSELKLNIPLSGDNNDWRK